MEEILSDDPLSYPKRPRLQHGSKQPIQSIEMKILSPTSETHNSYDFQLPPNEVILFGPSSGFLINGVFESKVNRDADDATFSKVDENCGSEMALQPNWFEHLISDVRVSIGNQMVKVHDVPREADPFLNSYLFAHMNKGIQNYLFPEPHNPGRCGWLSINDWSLSEESSAWRKYSKELFSKKPISFRYVPSFQFPFHQNPDFHYNGGTQAALPLSIVGNTTISLRLKDDMDGIFMKPESNEKVYRFRIESVQLIVEEARVNYSSEKMLSKKRESLVYQGMTKIGICENINAGSLKYICKFENIYLPEGIFVFALNKEASAGIFKSSMVTGKVFSEHNIKNIQVSFGNRPLTMDTPRIGDIRHPAMVIKQFLDHIQKPPFGVLQQPGASSYNRVKEGGDGSLFPHVYIDLTISKNKTRIIPAGDIGNLTTKRDTLVLDLRFGDDGATENVTYMAYVFYTDVNILYDIKKKTFETIYC